MAASSRANKTPAMLTDLAHRLADSPVSLALTERTWAVALLQALHIVAVGLLLFAAGYATVAVWRGREHAPALPLPLLLKVVWLALSILALTGVAMVLSDPPRTLLNVLFQTKLALVGVGLVASVWLGRRIGCHAGAKALAAGWLALWLGVIICGRLIAYFGAPPAA
jgi:hypothetical protein